MKKLLFFTFLIFVTWTSSASPSKLDTYLTYFDDVKSISPEASVGVDILMHQVLTFESKASILKLAQQDQRLALKNIWWSSKKRKVRLTALFLSVLGSPTDDFESNLARFEIYSKRFKEKESKERLQEVEFAKKKYRVVARVLLDKVSNLKLKESLRYYSEKHHFSSENYDRVKKLLQ